MSGTAIQVLEPVGGFSNFTGFTASNWVFDSPPAGRPEPIKQTARSEDAICKQGEVLATSIANIISLDEWLAAAIFAREKDALLGAIRKLASLPNGWDGEDGCAPTAGIVDDAVAVAQAWPTQLPLPTIGVDVDGHIVLDLIDNSGLVVAGFDFIGRDRLAVYSIVGGPSGKIDTTATTAIIKAFSNLCDAVVDGGN